MALHIHTFESILQNEDGPFSIGADSVEGMGLSEKTKHSLANLAEKHGWEVSESTQLPDREVIFTLIRREHI